mgnify:CR=1 FL=1
MADQHPLKFIQACQDSDFEVGYYPMDDLSPKLDDPDSVIISRAHEAAAQINGAKASPSTTREDNVIHAQFGKC